MSVFPPLNASLNAVTALLLIVGYFFIKRGAIAVHKFCMVCATFTSTVFLSCYLYYHAYHGVTRFPGQGVIRLVYFTILGSHTFLAIVQVPLILTTLYRAAKGQWDKHKRIAGVTLPIWLYVSVTGVLVYLLLYQVRYY